jgi:hypothetical protein
MKRRSGGDENFENRYQLASSNKPSVPVILPPRDSAIFRARASLRITVRYLKNGFTAAQNLFRMKL